MYIYIQNTAVSRVLVRHLCFSPNFQVAGAQIYGLKAPTFVSLSVPFETTLISDRTNYKCKCTVLQNNSILSLKEPPLSRRTNEDKLTRIKTAIYVFEALFCEKNGFNVRVNERDLGDFHFAPKRGGVI